MHFAKWIASGAQLVDAKSPILLVRPRRGRPTFCIESKGTYGLAQSLKSPIVSRNRPLACRQPNSPDRSTSSLPHWTRSGGGCQKLSFNTGDLLASFGRYSP